MTPPSAGTRGTRGEIGLIPRIKFIIRGGEKREAANVQSRTMPSIAVSPRPVGNLRIIFTVAGHDRREIQATSPEELYKGSALPRASHAAPGTLLSPAACLETFPLVLPRKSQPRYLPRSGILVRRSRRLGPVSRCLRALPRFSLLGTGADRRPHVLICRTSRPALLGPLAPYDPCALSPPLDP